MKLWRTPLKMKLIKEVLNFKLMKHFITQKDEICMECGDVMLHGSCVYIDDDENFICEDCQEEWEAKMIYGAMDRF